jgi:beta-barrel assembly-enhancing protease
MEAESVVKRELQYGRLLAAQILKKYPVLNDEKAVMYVNKVGKSVAMFSGRTDIEYHFGILDTEGINAFATPGGYIFITKGALVNMSNEAELAGVLAHEIAHVNMKHIMKELPPPRETGGFVSFVASILVARGAAVSGAFSEVVNKATELLFSKGYKRDDEFEADRVALQYAAETGYFPGGLPQFIKKIQSFKESHGSAVVYNTHPSNNERLSAIEKAMKAGKYDIKRPTAEGRFSAEMKHLKSGK